MDRHGMMRELLRTRVQITETERERIRQAVAQPGRLELHFMILARRILRRARRDAEARRHGRFIREECLKRLARVRTIQEGRIGIAVPTPGALAVCEDPEDS